MLIRNIESQPYVILTEHTAEITPREEHRSTPVETLYARLLPAMWRDHIDLGCLRSDQTRPCRLISIHAAFSWTQVAFTQMGIGQ